MSERRRLRRQRTILGGIASFNRRQSTSDCMIRNLTDEGALLLFENAILLPDEFDLTITARDKTVRVRTVWRGPNGAGVAFSDRRAADPVPLEVVRKLRRARIENATLKQRIADLST